MKNLTKLDIVTKIILIILVGVIFYFAIFAILKPFFITQPTSMMNMMSQMMNFSTRNSTVNIISLIFALCAALTVSIYLFQVHDKEYNIIRKALSEDEKKILDEIKKAGEITQDSLRFRLNWSKAKTSTILTNLDKMSLIQRERIGKTYKVYLQTEK